MADPLDDSGPDESQPGLLPEGEFASHFFQEVAHPDQAAQSNPESAAALLPTHSSLSELPPPPPDTPVGHPIFPVIMGLGFLVMMVVGAVLSASAVPEPPSSGASATATAPAAEAPAKESAVNALAENLKTEVGSLSKQFKDLEERLAALPKSSPVPDFAALTTKVADLSKSAESVAALPKKVDALDERVGGLDTSLKSLQDGMTPLKNEIAALRDDLKKAAPTAKPTAETVNVNVEGQSFAQAVELFKAGKYQEASRVLKTTEDNDPKDARVWYYAAMSRGLATNDWVGDTQKLVLKGVEREKAGTPTVAEIDAEFAKLAPATVKTWLDFYRKGAK